MVVGSNITEMNSPSAWNVWCRTWSPGAGQRRRTYVYHEPSFWILELIDTWVTERRGGRLIRRVDNWTKKDQSITPRLVVCHCVVTPSQNSGHNLVADSASAATRLLILWWRDLPLPHDTFTCPTPALLIISLFQAARKFQVNFAFAFLLFNAHMDFFLFCSCIML